MLINKILATHSIIQIMNASHNEDNLAFSYKQDFVPLSKSRQVCILLKSLTGEYSKLQPHHNISLSQNKLSGAVEIFLAVLFRNL